MSSKDVLAQVFRRCPASLEADEVLNEPEARRLRPHDHAAYDDFELGFDERDAVSTASHDWSRRRRACVKVPRQPHDSNAHDERISVRGLPAP